MLIKILRSVLSTRTVFGGEYGKRGVDYTGYRDLHGGARVVIIGPILQTDHIGHIDVKKLVLKFIKRIGKLLPVFMQSFF